MVEPRDADSFHDTSSCRWLGSKVNPVGVDGAAKGVVSALGDHGPRPLALRARTRASYLVPFVSPLIVAAVLVAG